MRVLRSDDLYIATHISGPTHNMLGLDFSREREQYETDLSESDSPSGVTAASVRRQVLQAFDDADIDADVLVGIQFNADDTPSESVYYELARAIVHYRESGATTEELSRVDITATDEA